MPYLAQANKTVNPIREHHESENEASEYETDDEGEMNEENRVEYDEEVENLGDSGPEDEIQPVGYAVVAPDEPMEH